MSIQPMNNYMLIDKLEMEKLDSKLVLPNAQQQRTYPNKGKVIRVGPEVEDVKVDDVVLFHAFAGVDVGPNTKRMLLQEGEVFAVERPHKKN